MLLIDRDSKPEETIFYISVQIFSRIKKQKKIKIADLDKMYDEIDSKEPYFKFNFALDFLYLLNKVNIVGDDIVYVSDKLENI